MGGRFPSGSWRHEEWRPSKGVWGRTRPLRADTRAPHPLKGRAAPAPRFLHSPHSGRAAQRPSRPLTPFLHAGSGLLPAGLFPLPPPALFPFPPRHTRGVTAWCLCLRRDPSEMQNDAGEFVDLYVPRKCSASNRIIGAKDHASIQINISEVDKVTGRVNGQFKTYAICGPIRRMGESDDSILRLAKNDGIVSKNF
uniref:Small ribosomal subunit protein eS21 n=1 Tax=Amazona collaria TaxID=241587 RepID=A0A8B9FKP7_9PSIT